VDVPNPNPAVIKVASVADPGKYQTANVTVTDNIAVTLSPSSASVLLGGTQLFKATISNTTNNTLKWYVNGVLNGNSTQGTLGSCLAWAGGQQCLYTAPANAVPNPNPAVIEVASAADPAKYATASVTVTDNIAVTLSPTSATVALGGTQEFTATISNTTNTDLDWYVNGVQNGNSTQGTLDSCVGIIGAGKWECKYTAPATAVPNPNPAVIKAASVADPTKYATANVTVTP
jgi:archaellum component FlaF (FlaF/FlaG flagellin family)